MFLNKIKICVEYVFNALALYRLPHRRAERRAYLLLTPQYLNYGDQALALGAIQYLKEYLTGFEVVEVNYSFLSYWPERFKAQVQPQDILVFVGGGYMGDLWPESQMLVNDILESFPGNTTIILPQSIYFSDGDSALLQKTKELFANHNDLWVFLREDFSFQYVTKVLLPQKKERCYLTPDSATLLTVPTRERSRRGVLLVFRDDHEKVVSQDKQDMLTSYCREKGMAVRRGRMMIPHVEIPTWLRSCFLRYKWRQYAGSELVITDRLHGMIFAFITGTPCLAFDNVSHKVLGVYTWIKDCAWIKIADEGWKEQINALLSMGPQEKGLTAGKLEDSFSALRQLLERINGGSN